MMQSVTVVRVRYAETDAMGIVHHAVYPVWMELGRSDLLRQLGQSYADWERRGVRMSVAELRVRYRAPARYDELIEVRSGVKEAGRRRVVFAYEVARGETRLAEGESVHIVTGPDGRARAMPEDLLALISRALWPESGTRPPGTRADGGGGRPRP
jgi:acyl-CoA thioester hydrolase